MYSVLGGGGNHDPRAERAARRQLGTDHHDAHPRALALGLRLGARPGRSEHHAQAHQRYDMPNCCHHLAPPTNRAKSHAAAPHANCRAWCSATHSR